jgi:hypothetical protein
MKDNVEYKQLNAWLLNVSINLTLFAIAELEPAKMKHIQKMRFMNLRNANMNFQSMLNMNGDAKNMAFDSVGNMVELMGMVAMVHPEMEDWFMNEVKKLVHHSVNVQAEKYK